MSISENIKICRIQNNLTQKQLGEKVFVSDKTISKWESNRSVPDVDTIKRLAEILNVEYDVLIDGEEARSKQDTMSTKIRKISIKYSRQIISGLILLFMLILSNLINDDIAYFIIYFSIIGFTLLQIFNSSKWYLIGLLIALMQLSDEMNTYLHFDFDLWFLSLFLLGIFIILIIFLIKLVKNLRVKDYFLISVFLGNLFVVIFILFMS
ncbi:helix-turn-helix domain-containing protein [Mariniplasma anaerobium]|uniref:Uncharacterized protein n=1 Tax=Mariniplasma anaerobium TaxID=2735436 RepID=A0A7U9XWG0_9MOLU|nr:helix-turn-helix transcriptional regulator [Mariniplasma anaerobium]BCR35223.1 hypothetical protein MPAN_001160 [Mariniplasma anaerobium]